MSKSSVEIKISFNDGSTEAIAKEMQAYENSSQTTSTFSIGQLQPTELTLSTKEEIFKKVGSKYFNRSLSVQQNVIINQEIKPTTAQSVSTKTNAPNRDKNDVKYVITTYDSSTLRYNNLTEEGAAPIQLPHSVTVKKSPDKVPVTTIISKPIIINEAVLVPKNQKTEKYAHAFEFKEKPAATRWLSAKDRVKSQQQPLSNLTIAPYNYEQRGSQPIVIDDAALDDLYKIEKSNSRPIILNINNQSAK